MKFNRLFSLLSICILLLAACNKKDAPPSTLTADKSAINLTAAAGKEYLQVTANVEWSLSGLPTGVTATPASGKGDTKVEIVYPANTSVEPVTGTISLTATGVPTVTILYKQLGSAPSILSDKTTVTADPAGKTETVVITSNVAWKLTLPAGMNWIAADKTAGAAGSTTITFTIIENQIGKEREAAVSFTEALGTTALANIGFKQLQPDVVITSRTAGAKGGGLVVIDGLGFSPVKEENIVTINGQPATITKAEHNHLELTVPAKAGSGNIVVKVNAKTAAPVSFTYQWVWRSTTFAGTGDAAVLDAPGALVVDSDNNLFVAEMAKYRIKKISSGGSIELFAGSGVEGNSDDDIAANATFGRIVGLTMDKNKNLYAVHYTAAALRKITPAGKVTTIERYGYLGNPFSVAVDGDDNVFVTQADLDNVRKITPGGAFYDFPVAPGSPIGIAVDKNNIPYIFSNDNGKFYKKSSTGAFVHFTGKGYGAEDGPADQATFNSPDNIVFDADNNMYVADENNSTIRMVTPAGEVTTIAGNAFQTRADVDGVGSAARFSGAVGIAIDKNGNLYVADTGNNKIKKLTKE
ncbi:IPT/TIG domain-containing protein [Paraflavitalea sp. CAU 1676]|uniref:IPT/TIG domain-containing protein n=1 Tax=Paraflavitalea sp. CAU 1676 TaxID=3032598 RepID=UPI0023DCB6E0|nr:IPT/TIG domain-containing protein [Paraflavitalea sp. CAU 1676]MDF2192418.1 IPT/TIG domain-containing protein [Paraflavitalea sp. CAU 1676]